MRGPQNIAMPGQVWGLAAPDPTGPLDQGQVVFALGDELLLFRDTGLGPLDTGTWPCGDSNLHGNPATHLTT
jgi:hypothetical protein